MITYRRCFPECIPSSSNFIRLQFVAMCGSLLALFVGGLLFINGDCRGTDCQLQRSAAPFQISGAVIQWLLAAFAAVSMCSCCAGCLSDEDANIERAAQNALNQQGLPMASAAPSAVFGNGRAYGQMYDGAASV